MEKNQSAFWEYHCTETTLIKVKSDILKVMDNQEITCLVLQDLSAAFDMVEHGILLNRLNNRFSIQGIALKWIESYLTGRTQKSSYWRPGHQPWCMFWSRNTNIWHFPRISTRSNYVYSLHGSSRKNMQKPWHNIPTICWWPTDVHLLHTEDKRCPRTQVTMTRGLHCWGQILDVHQCTKLNDDKTEFIVFWTAQQLNKSDNITVKAGGMETTTCAICQTPRILYSFVS